MLAQSNPLGVGWLDPTDGGTLIDPESVLDAIFGGTGPYRPVEAPACGRVHHVDPAVTVDGLPRTFTCYRLAGHPGPCRHIYTDEAELARDGHEPEAAWWVAIQLGAP